jgi:hypothetical protein
MQFVTPGCAGTCTSCFLKCKILCPYCSGAYKLEQMKSLFLEPVNYGSRPYLVGGRTVPNLASAATSAPQFQFT